MDAAYAIPVVLALVVGLFVVRHIATRQRRLLNRYRRRRDIRTLTRPMKAKAPDTNSPRSDMRAFEHPSSVLDATATRPDAPAKAPGEK